MTRAKLPKRLVAGSLFLLPILAFGQAPVFIGQDGLDPELAEFMKTAEYTFAFQAGALILMVIAIAAMALYFANQREKRKQDLIVRFVENGQEVPGALLQTQAIPSRRRELRRGIWLASLGLGIGLALYIATDDWRIAAWCLILLFLSAASFINAAFFVDNDESRNGPADSG